MAASNLSRIDNKRYLWIYLITSASFTTDYQLIPSIILVIYMVLELAKAT